MTIAQYYNQARRRMEVPIIVIGGVDTSNYISFCSLKNSDLITEFNSIAYNGDKVQRYANGRWYTATYFNGNWFGYPNDVNPIEAGVGYVYKRVTAGGNTTWCYDCVFYPSTTRSQLCIPIGTKGVMRQ